jgi:hypothetical protein
MLKPQDILVALKLVALGTQRWTYSSLAESLGLSVSETHAAVKRGLESRLLTKLDHKGHKAERPLPNLAHLERLIVHGLPYWMPVSRGPRKICMGMPTADGVSPLDDEFFRPAGYVPPVWPVRGGKVQGWALAPIHRTCPAAARRDAKLYELLTLVDGLRGGKARVRQAAQRILLERFASSSRELRS